MKKILLIGAGSVGGYFCGRAASAGAEVEVVLRSGCDIIAQTGFQVDSIAGDFHFSPAKILASAADASPDTELVVLATKVLPETDRVALLAPVLRKMPDVPVMLIQNGVGIEDEIAAAFPNEIISAVAYIGASRIAVNHIRHTGAGNLIIGCFEGGVSPAVKMVADSFNASGVPCVVSDNIALERWRKLLWNLPFNPVSVLGGGLNSRELCDNGEVEQLCSALMDEVIRTANAAGVPLTGEMAEEQIEYTRNFPPYKTSMLQDFEAGRPLESGAILGNMIKIAERYHVPVPYSRCCAVLLNARDRKNRQ
ncbi:MAG: 2-dehydropantoate 2-reductase [Lentisphaerae bacterium]|nr:2-dehydropantoate 2-reductase [Lentisphaerota bacterium]